MPKHRQEAFHACRRIREADAPSTRHRPSSFSEPMPQTTPQKPDFPGSSLGALLPWLLGLLMNLLLEGLELGFLFGAEGATGGGAIQGADGADDGKAICDRGVSGAKIVAGDAAMGVGNPGGTIGKSAEPKSGDTGGLTGTMYCSTGGGASEVLGALLRTALGLVDGAGLSIGRLFDDGAAGAASAACAFAAASAAVHEPEGLQ